MIDTYNLLADRIESIHPELLQEIDGDDLGDREKYFTLGSFVEILPKARATTGWDQYYIWIRVDDEEYSDPDILAATLAHEYGHFLCRTILYPMLFWLGQYMTHKMSDRPIGKHSDSMMTNLVIVVEELLAWIFGWCVLLQLDALKWNHLQFGFNCWKGYWWRIKP